jgi:hypothetical protein
MRKNTIFENGFFPASDAFKKRQPAFHRLKHIYIHKIGSRKPMLGNEHRFLVSRKLGNKVGRLAL